MAELRLHSMHCALCWKYTMLATLAMLMYFATWAQMVARFVRLPPRQLIPKWMFSPALWTRTRFRLQVSLLLLLPLSPATQLRYLLLLTDLKLELE
ncbi:hypothetical protein ACLKA6_019819 [Drosophila palustris]